MIEPLAKLAADAAAVLKERKQTIAVAEGATGGLVSAGLLTVSGATGFYLGGGMIYSFKGRDILLDLSKEDLEGMQSVTEPYALLQARAIRDRFGAHWGIAESGSAGPTHPFGIAAGKSCIALIGPGVSVARSIDVGDRGRVGNMEAFALAALELLNETLGA